MKKGNDMLIKKIDTKHIVWFQNSNSYLIFEDSTTAIIKKLHAKQPISEIENWCCLKLEIPKNIAKKFVNDLVKLIQKQHQKPCTKVPLLAMRFVTPNTYNSSKHYLINEVSFLIEFETEFLESLIHPKFAHLEALKMKATEYHYQIFQNDEHIIFLVNGKHIGSWSCKDIHLFQGKFSMQITQHTHQKEAHEWLGVFHASAVGNDTNSLLFLGDSGNGKSTSLALLQANGFKCLADDFVPIDAKKQEVYSFPAAISIKKNSLKTLYPFYPKLKAASEYRFKRLQKTVRFLAPNNLDYTTHLPCKALVFIYYKQGIRLELKTISKVKAFEKLIPDAWISPIKENVALFLDWFLKSPCYQLHYSDAEKMIETVHKIFNDDL
ncbi:MAG: hypothetical protein P8K77_05480 [Polaribacter sp.]|nr:hypothetical protein [Polaribacter sp.]